MLERAGSVDQDQPRRFIRVLQEVSVHHGQSSARLSPASSFAVHMEIDYGDPVIGRGSGEFDILHGDFRGDLCRARTFCFLSDVARMRAQGMALGGSLDNALVVDGERVLNKGGLRHPDEFLRHKALDAVGDLALLGSPILGRFQGRRSGHTLNHELLRHLKSNSRAWEYTVINGPAHLGRVGTG
jgi:UDP-3-O-[3-hydroxymyristoyl] N-acetylglucosamine deacetylase